MEHKGELTPLESRLVECADTGAELDCAPLGDTVDDIDQIDDWEKRKIRAEVLVALCTGEVDDWSVHSRRGLQLRGAYIVGEVDLSRAQMAELPLAFHTCRFELDMVLDQASTSDLRFTSCVLKSLIGTDSKSTASLHLTDTRLQEISLSHANFEGRVELSGVHLSNPDGTALDAGGMSASGVILRNTRVEGAVRLEDANIDGQLCCRGGTKLLNRRGDALNADLMHASSVTFSNTHVEGKLSLIGADIGASSTAVKGPS